MRISVKKTLFFISSAIILTSRFWGVNTTDGLRYALMAAWDLYFVLSYFSYREMNEKKQIIRLNLCLALVPFVIFFIYTIFLWVGGTGVIFANFTRLCSTFLRMSLVYTYACTAIYLFYEKGVDILFWAGVCSYACGSVLYLITSYGISGLNSYIRTLIFGENSVANYAMEVHDLTFAMGNLFLFYLFFEKKSEKNHKTKIVTSLLLILLGLKRIEIMALGIAILLYLVLIRWGKTIKARATICAVGAITVCLSYIFIIKSGILSALVMQFGIEDSGRISYYLFSNRFYEFKIGYPGKGWTWFGRYFQQLNLSGFRIDGHGVAASIHSDILMMFIEIGFILFVIWIAYMFMARPIILERKQGTLTSECVLLLTLYMFILYLTDNTLNYLDTQLLFLLVPMTVAIQENYRSK